MEQFDNYLLVMQATFTELLNHQEKRNKLISAKDFKSATEIQNTIIDPLEKDLKEKRQLLFSSFFQGLPQISSICIENAPTDTTLIVSKLNGEDFSASLKDATTLNVCGSNHKEVSLLVELDISPNDLLNILSKLNQAGAKILGFPASSHQEYRRSWSVELTKDRFLINWRA